MTNRRSSPLKRARLAAQAVMLAALLAALAGRDLHHVIYPAAVIRNGGRRARRYRPHSTRRQGGKS